ncbi:hypothetical protein [Nocardioides marmoriginsengisoli]|uniref:hypothetical protein n=1 Tax=Nocardioides marmoriginsengisoli TaxID=661483 RepID=UPI0011CE5214|nr:hypothetical protein [Nocardioides marmoriginsengisoli]
MRKYLVAVAAVALVASGCGGGSGDSEFCSGSSTSGCTEVPKAAAKEDFCAAGAAFSGSKGFKNGLKAARRLAAVGTPNDIEASARAGFVELVERMVDSKDGPDFRGRTRNLSSAESKHLLDLDTYIQATC